MGWTQAYLGAPRACDTTAPAGRAKGGQARVLPANMGLSTFFHGRARLGRSMQEEEQAYVSGQHLGLALAVLG